MTWRSRCYLNDIPDEVTDELQKSGRVPSYKAIAMAILKNDMILKSLGFEGKYSQFCRMLKTINSQQLDLF